MDWKHLLLEAPLQIEDFNKNKLSLESEFKNAVK